MTAVYLLDASITCKKLRIYGVPNGGVPIVALLTGMTPWRIIEEAEQADLIVDDLVDSGRTLRPYVEQGKQVLALYRKPHSPKDIAPDALELDGWLEFPWERTRNEAPAEDAICRMLQAIGEDPTRNGLLDTPKRVVKSWRELFAGYQMNPEEIVRVFDVPEAADDIVLLRDIEFFSTCEHHMLPFHGRAHIAYIPKDNTHVLGISKLARLLEVYARRLQVQERIGNQVTSFLMGSQVQALGAACVIEAKHMCCSARGIAKQHSVMVTSSLQGVFRDNTAARAEVLGLMGVAR